MAYWLIRLSFCVCVFVCVQFQIKSPDAQGVNAVQQCKAKNFSATAKEAVVLWFSGFLHDTLSHLSSVSETLQKSAISIADAHSCLSSTHAVLERYKTRYALSNKIMLFWSACE